MATMIKEKRKDKKKSKEKPTRTNFEADTLKREEYVSSSTETEFLGLQNVAKEIKNINTKTEADIEKEDEKHSEEVTKESKLCLPEQPKTSPILKTTESNSKVDVPIVQQQLLPSAPIFHEPESVSNNVVKEVVKQIEIPTLSCIPLEDAIRIFGGREIAEVRALSVREEAIVEAGPKNNPDNPLVDLLSTFRSSLVAVERERNRISCGYIEEEKSRATLWKVEKRSVVISENCTCGSNVTLQASYDVAELQKERMPAARLRLESLLREVQETYCHHQHMAILTHYDIDELLSEIVNDSKERVREALALIFQAMKLSDGVPDSFAEALQRWAGILAAALLDTQEMGHLLFLMHYLFRQTRSVHWASSVVYVRVWDAGSVAVLLALLELMLTRPPIEKAFQCTEEYEIWEEVDEGGEGGAVGEGRLRERDLLALLEALPLRDMVAKLVLFTRQDINQETEDTWCDSSGGHGVLKACCGVRTLLHVFQCATHTHASYTRLHAHLQKLSIVVLDALTGLHQRCGTSYKMELEERISVELEACFAAGLILLGDNIHRLPATLLRQHVAKEYCTALMNGLHETSPLMVSSLGVCVSVPSCAVRVRALALVATQRTYDHELASTVVEFLFQTGIKPGPVRCGGGCAEVCRELMPQVLSAHRDLHTAVFYMLADLEDASPEVPPSLCAWLWRPHPDVLLPLLQHWSRRRPAVLPHLLLALHYEPHEGLSLDSQLAIGSWLCSRGEAPEWAWRVLRQLRVHRSQWGLPLEAPSHEPRDPLSTAFALLAGDWGHCIPLACGPGADALLQLARCRPLDAAHCLGPVMVVMAQSPESVALTPRFTEILTAILNHGVSIVQYALRRSPPGEEALRRLLEDQLRDTSRGRSALLSAWLHALWVPSLPVSARVMLERAVALCRDWTTLDAHAAALLQSEHASAHVSCAVGEAACCPLLCCAVLRALLLREQGAAPHAALLHELARQRAAGERIHVDNALKAVGWSPAPMLCVYGCARAVLRAVPQHPAHVLLARLLLHAYLQRHQTHAAPVGTLFFSGLIQSRLYLAPIKKKLREFAIYHRERAALLKERKSTPKDEKPEVSIVKMKAKIDNSLFPTLKISDFISNSSSCEEEHENRTEESTSDVDMSENRDTFNLICYHTALEQLCSQYALWLDEGDKVRASPHHADITTVLSEQAFDAAWRDYLKTTASGSSPSPTPPTTPSPREDLLFREHLTHFERAVESIQSINNGSKNKLRTATLPEPLHESHFKNDHMLYELLDNSINQLKKASDEWSVDVTRVSSLDGRLWQLVAALRVARPLPAVRQPCPKGCADIVVTISEEEWVVSSGVSQGIIENRCSARSGVRALARPRPAAARAAAVLLAVARRVRSPPLALGVCQRAWGAVPGLERYGPGADALASLVESLVTKFISRDIDTSLRLLEAWGGSGDSSLRRRLCGALVGGTLGGGTLRGGTQRQHRAQLYAAVLRLPLAPHVTFSYLSKFDLHNWADTAHSSERNEILETIVNAAERLGPTPDDKHSVLLEQLGVHALAVVRDAELCSHVMRVMTAAARCRLPPQLVTHLPAAVRACTHLHHDELGHVLRGAGSSWWAARVSMGGSRPALFSSYAPLVADALYALTDAFVDSAVRCSYTPERVSWYAWSAATESWSSWLAPHAAPPLLPQHTTDHHSLATRFADTLVLVMHRCPGCEEHLLRHAWEWTVQTYLSMEPAWPTECRLQMATLLTVLADLPWHLQWFHVSSLPLALQVCSLPQEAVVRWCCATLQRVEAQSWLRGVEDHQLAHALDGLLALFTSKHLVLPQESYSQVSLLPWVLLPLAALDAALQKYFQEHYSPAVPYHDKPQFKALLSASLLLPPAGDAPPDPGPPERRARAVSQWVRAACSPALAPHVRAHCQRVLDVLADIAPHLERSEGELEELLSRAVVVMCIEPAAAAALPVWVSRVRSSPPRLRRACASAACSLTVLEYFAPLADCIARAEIGDPVSYSSEGGGWSSLVARWARCAWWAPDGLLRRGSAHAGYALHRAGARGLAGAFTALLGGSVKLSENEEIVAVWICVACRVMLRARTSDAEEALESEEAGGAGAEPEGEERRACEAAAHALLTRWAQRRRSLLQLVALQASDDCPTPRLQLLCRLALFVVSPSEATYSSYASACASVPCVPYVPSVPGAPEPRALPRAAVDLYPRREAYFEDELVLLARDSA